MIVAFLQNCYFKPDTATYITERYLEDPDFRRRVLSRSTTGSRLHKAFGTHYSSIHWDNASTNIGRYSSAKFPADLSHMSAVLDRLCPTCVLTFGTVATYGMVSLKYHKPLAPYRFEHHAFKHPCAFGLTQFQLDEFAREIISRYMS